MNVLLISANREDINMLTLPMGLASVAAAVEKAGHAVRFLDLLSVKDIPGEHHTYLQYLVQPRSHLFEPPVLTILDESGEPMEQLKYKEDFTKITRYAGSSGDEQARVMGAAYGPVRDPALNDEYGLSNSPAMDHILIVHADDIEKVNSKPVKGVLVIANETFSLDRRDLQPYFIMPNEKFRPYMVYPPKWRMPC